MRTPLHSVLVPDLLSIKIGSHPIQSWSGAIKAWIRKSKVRPEVSPTSESRMPLPKTSRRCVPLSPFLSRAVSMRLSLSKRLVKS
jgi:hypothetical protein